MRHTLFKILVCICLFFLVIIVLIVSLPSVVTNSVFGLDGSMVDMENPTTLLESYNDLAADISAVVEEGYDAALAKVEQIIEDGGYDYDLSMDALINYAQGSAGYDVSYILAAYSASLQQRNTGKEDMLAKLRSKLPTYVSGIFRREGIGANRPLYLRYIQTRYRDGRHIEDTDGNHQWCSAVPLYHSPSHLL